MLLIALPEALSCKLLSVDLIEELPELMVVQSYVVLLLWTLLLPLRTAHPGARSNGLAQHIMRVVSPSPYEG